MKIYFEDGELVSSGYLPIDRYIVVNAGSGVNTNIKVLDDIKEYNPNAVVYTNSIFAFSNIYAWNEELKVPEIYIRAGEHMLFTRIDKLTNRELREGHNLAKMYVSGEFDNHIKEWIYCSYIYRLLNKVPPEFVSDGSFLIRIRNFLGKGYKSLIWSIFSLIRGFFNYHPPALQRG